MSNLELGPARPLFDGEINQPKNKRFERLRAGSGKSGVIIDVTRSGVEISAYYTGNRNVKYLVLREPVTMSWEELEKIHKEINLPKSKRKELVPDLTEDEIDEEYILSLPKVTINGKLYYIDPDRKERRPVDNPRNIFKY
jgi:hypothetical protein